MKLHIGCGDKRLETHINIDIRPTIATDMVLPDITKMPFEDNTATEIYTCHMIEHLHRDTAVSFLNECRRILMPKSILKIELPLVNLIFAQWKAGNIDDDRMIGCLYGLHRYKEDRHLYGYTDGTFTYLLQTHKFAVFSKKVGRSGYKDYKLGMIYECLNSSS